MSDYPYDPQLMPDAPPEPNESPPQLSDEQAGLLLIAKAVAALPFAAAAWLAGWGCLALAARWAWQCLTGY